ncbi:MAG: hypothetical protein ISP53_05015 [Flavobacteriaceae bacterium]|nr:hypothetical protein [Flavobacteriaceae bacterium]
MSKSGITLCLIVFPIITALSQTPVKSRKLKGQWELQIQVAEAVAEETKDLGVFGKMLAGAVAGFVDVALESVDVVFDFYNKDNVRLTVKTDDEAPEIESLNYRIDQGKLYIKGLEEGDIDISIDGYWMFEGKNLIHFNEDGDRVKNVYLIRRR